MADLAALGRAHETGLADTVGREVVVEHEALTTLALDRVDKLRIPTGTEGSHHHGLGFATREDGRAVGPRQRTDFHGNRPHLVIRAAVNALLAADDPPAYDLGFQGLEGATHLAGRPALGLLLGGDQARLGLLLGGHDRLLALLLVDHVVGVGEPALGDLAHLLGQRRVRLRRLPIPTRLAGLGGELLNGLNRGLHLLVAEEHGIEHGLLGQPIGLGLHHEHGFLGAGDHEIELGVLAGLREGRVEHELAVDVANPAAADGAVPGDTRESQGSGGADHRRDVRIDLVVHRDDGGDHLHLAGEPVREQRAQGPVDQARGERFLLRGAPLALEEAARDLARRVGTLLVIDRQRQEVPRLTGLLTHRGDQHHGIGHINKHGPSGLPRDAAGLKGDLMLTELELLFDGIRSHGRLSLTGLLIELTGYLRRPRREMTD